ncbi:MAG: ribose-phosphate pyrophosphokinase [Bacillati bacterium ANGP1]|uniref:ribose-phosphate diphosphokinase n=1 Tax=Candidatus Segetimicrobium genomatis TaxID=2569760 RepID=A0A537JEY3_9BACT|nr:MAG: ribose-phosphate pyrophosphokinase [Terrabacteria group bacterium ANGP1]
MKVFCGTANRPLGQEVADELSLALGQVTIRRFEDGEIYARFEESVRGDDVFVIQPTCPPVNENLMELLVMVDALRRASAGRITAVIPYYGYARQDKKHAPREPITGRLVADLLQSAGVHRILALDLDADQIEGFFNIPVDHLRALPLFAAYLAEKALPPAVVVAPDDGAVKIAYRLAERLRLPLSVVFQRRLGPDAKQTVQVVGEVEGRIPILIDRILSTGGNIASALDALIGHGARPEAYVCATHAVLAGPVAKTLDRDDVQEFAFTNSIPIPPEMRTDRIRILSAAPLLARAMRNIHLNESVSTLFT